jgi:AcrR family transcriptional regulator
MVARRNEPRGEAGPADVRAPRSDAQLNRARIIAAAMAALLRSGDASLNSIAKDAGVGIGTLYRHFPSREALLVAVYRNELQQLVDAAPSLLDEHPPLDALRHWLDRLAHHGRAKVGLANVLAAMASHERLTTESYEPVIGALALLLHANEAAGTIRAGIDPDDVLLMLGFLWRVSPDDAGQAKANRMLDLVLNGLQADAPAAGKRARCADSSDSSGSSGTTPND